ncbi:MAG: hypothetical protein LBJ16_00405 [Holosporaceae bacterium]|nr:hypothetical protein [Holosporaceae bacterium]
MVHVAHEDPSTEATQKLPKERMFRKKSNIRKDAQSIPPQRITLQGNVLS